MPGLAGLVNAADMVFSSTNAALTEVYGNLGVKADFNDIDNGNRGPYAGYLAVKGWDFRTGVGSVRGKNGK